MRRTVFIDVLLLGFFLFSTPQTFAQDKTVIIPLLGKEPSGDAQPEHVLEGITFSNASGTGLIGTMPDIGKQDITPTTVSQTISEGYHDGSGIVAGDADLVPENIKAGVSIFGVTGTFTCSTQISKNVKKAKE